MKPAAFDYTRPETLSDAIRILADAGGAAAPICGGQSLLVLMGLRLTMIERLVDVSRLKELHEIYDDGRHVFVGAAITHAMIEDGRIPDPSSGLMARIAGKIAYRAIRNLGTIGGSVALADPAADWPTCLIALGADVSIAGPDGQRWSPVADFITGAYETILKPAEIVLGFRIPRRASLRWGANKVSRKSGAFADSIAIFVEGVDGDTPRAVLAGTSSRACLLPGVSRYAEENHALDQAELRAIILQDLAELAPDADGYQRRCHVATVSRAMTEARTS